MATVQYGPLVTEINGSISGLTFQRNLSGTCLKGKPNRKQYASLYQQQSRYNFITGVSFWQGLSSTNKALWNAFASAHPNIDYYGKSRTVSGFNYCLSLFCNAALTGFAASTTPPIYALIPPPVASEVSLVSSGGALNCFWQTSGIASSYGKLVFIDQPSQSPSTSKSRKLYFVKYISAGSAYPVDILPEYLAAFGFSSLPAGFGSTFFTHVAIAYIDSVSYQTSILASNNS